jgi:hypothetical protein
MTLAAYWFRFELLSQLEEPTKLLLEVGLPLHDTVHAFIQQKDGTFTRTLCGDTFPYGNKLIRHRNFIFPVEISPKERKQIYLRFTGQGAMHVSLNLRTEHAFFEHMNQEHLAYGVYFGLLLLILLYNTFLFISIRDRSYFLYVLYILCSLAYQSSLEGVAQTFLWPGSPWWANTAIPFSVSATILCVILFTQDFLKLSENLPRMNKLLSAIALLAAIGLIGSLFLSYHTIIRLVTTLAVPGAILCLLSSILAWRKGYKPARLYLAAWCAWLLGAIMLALSRLGALPRTGLTDNAHLVGFSLNAVLFSFALAAEG